MNRQRYHIYSTNTLWDYSKNEKYKETDYKTRSFNASCPFHISQIILFTYKVMLFLTMKLFYFVIKRLCRDCPAYVYTSCLLLLQLYHKPAPFLILQTHYYETLSIVIAVLLHYVSSWKREGELTATMLDSNEEMVVIFIEAIDLHL